MTSAPHVIGGTGATGLMTRAARRAPPSLPTPVGTAAQPHSLLR